MLEIIDRCNLQAIASFYIVVQAFTFIYYFLLQLSNKKLYLSLTGDRHFVKIIFIMGIFALINEPHHFYYEAFFFN